jgi:hypothetical protein
MVVDIARHAGWPWYAVVVFGVCWLALGLSAMWGFVAQISTRLDLQGVSQMSLLGMVRLRWQDISEMTEKKRMRLLVLSDGKRSITIALVAYSSPYAVQTWIRDRLTTREKPAKP